jgi:hypothetical protein
VRRNGRDYSARNVEPFLVARACVLERVKRVQSVAFRRERRIKFRQQPELPVRQQR